MKLTYKSVTREVTEIEVCEYYGNLVIDSRREEESGNRKYRRHNLSLDAITYEGLEYADPDNPETILLKKELSEKIGESFLTLTEIQQRRMIMLAGGMSLREIARREGVDIKTIRESIEGAQKKFKKSFED